MIIPATQFHQLFLGIKQETYESEEKKVTVLVSTLEADSVCAVKILQSVLEAERIHYTIYPITTFDDVRECCERQFNESEVLQTFILINCGASVAHVREYSKLAPTVRIVIVDAHRPVLYQYNDESKQEDVLVIDDDDPLPVTDIPKYYDDDDLSQDDGDRDQDGEEPRSKRRRLSGMGAGHSGRAERVAQRAAYELQGSGYGKPSSLVMYELAHSLQLNDNRLLWWAITGLADQLLHNRCATHDYDRWHGALAARVAAEGNLERSDHVTTADGLSCKMPHASIKIISTQDLRLPLLRHWTLHQALTNSPYVASRLQTWRDKGKYYIDVMLAKMGVPQSDAKIEFSAMRPEMQRDLADKLKDHAHKFNLNFDHLAFKSFMLTLGHDLRVTAADCAYAVSALLSMPLSEAVTYMDAFHRACDMLDLEESTAFLHMGIEHAKELQQAIVRDGGIALSRRGQFVHVRNHNLAVLDLEVVQAKQKRLFTHPAALTQMALFLRDARQYADKDAKGWSIMVAGADPRNHDLGPDEQTTRGTRCAVALPAKSLWKLGGFQANPFGVVLPMVSVECPHSTETSFGDPSMLSIKDPTNKAVLQALMKVRKPTANQQQEAEGLHL